jgi:pimeloyl-ACP methyl ester carboxylesterase
VTRVDLVLVHGAFHGPWCFDVVRPLLYERGIVAIAPELPLDSLAGDVAVVRHELDALDGPTVLLGHSYGGTVVTWAGEHPAVRSLVYLTAGVPDVGEGIGGGPPRELAIPTPAGFVPGSGGAISVEASAAVELFYSDADPAFASAWAARLRPTRFVAGEVVPQAAWRSRPSDYVLCQDDAVLPAATQRWLADRAGARVWELPGGHSPFLARPAALADALVAIVRARVPAT